MKIDVCMPTWNSGKYLERCLESIYREVKINKLIVVDRHSTDNTLKILGEYLNVKLIQSRGNLAEAREIMIENVETEFFLFVDSDAELKKDFMKVAERYIEDDVGAIAFKDEIDRTCIDGKYYSEIEKIQKNKSSTGIIEDKNMRGFTICTLIRTDSVRGIKIPKKYFALEDHFIKRYVEKKGYRWIIPPDKMCYHYHGHGNFLNNLRMMMTFGRVHRRLIGKLSIFQLAYRIVKHAHLYMFISLKTRDLRIFPYMMLRNILFVVGYLTPGDDIYLNRDKGMH